MKPGQEEFAPPPTDDDRPAGNARSTSRNFKQFEALPPSRHTVLRKQVERVIPAVAPEIAGWIGISIITPHFPALQRFQSRVAYSHVS